MDINCVAMNERKLQTFLFNDIRVTKHQSQGYQL